MDGQASFFPDSPKRVQAGTVFDAPVDPAKDGVDHINVYSKGATALGRGLTNFAHSPFTCADGDFASVEGYWYWLSVDPNEPRRDELRSAYGFKAKELGRELRGQDWNAGEAFEEKIKAAIDAKLAAHPGLAKALRESTLPLRHYYVYGGTVREPRDGRWVVEHFAQTRERTGERKASPQVARPAEVSRPTETRAQPQPKSGKVIKIMLGNVDVDRPEDVPRDQAVFYCGRTNGVAQRFGARHLSALGNEFIVGRDGAQGECALRFKEKIPANIAEKPGFKDALNEIAQAAIRSESGKVRLMCHCHPGPCHCGGIAEKVAEGLRKAGYTVQLPQLERQPVQQSAARNAPPQRRVEAGIAAGR